MQFSLVIETIRLMYLEILVLRVIQNVLCVDAIKILEIKNFGT